jgi:hypothetical protein
MAEKRCEPRYMCSELVNILIRYEDHTVHEAIANLEDISRSGACIQLDEAVRPGADIEIMCSTCSFKGKVRNCRHTGGRYDVGVAFDNVGAWDASRYEPAHLLPVETGLAYVNAHADAHNDASEENSRAMSAGAGPA